MSVLRLASSPALTCQAHSLQDILRQQRRELMFPPAATLPAPVCCSCWLAATHLDGLGAKKLGQAGLLLVGATLSLSAGVICLRAAVPVPGGPMLAVCSYGTSISKLQRSHPTGIGDMSELCTSVLRLVP